MKAVRISEDAVSPFLKKLMGKIGPDNADFWVAGLWLQVISQKCWTLYVQFIVGDLLGKCSLL